MNIEKKHFYILKLKSKDLIKIGISDFVFARIDSLNKTHDVDFDNSYIISSPNERIPVLFEMEFLAYFDEYRDFSLKPLDGYTEILKAVCFEKIIEEIKLKASRFPNHCIEINKGIDMPDEIISREKKWEELLFKLKVYGYYLTGICNILSSIKDFNIQLTALKKKDNFSFQSVQRKLKLSWDDTFIRISKERARLGLIYPFVLEENYYQPMLEELESIEKKVRLDFVGLEELYIITIGILTMLSTEEYPSPQYSKFKEMQFAEINMMKRSLKPSNRFLSWEKNINETKIDINLIDEYFSDKLYEDSIQIKD